MPTKVRLARGFLAIILILANYANLIWKEINNPNSIIER
jgi:hypothetical protein